MAIQEANKVVGKLLETGYKTLSKMEFYIDSVDDLENLPDENGCLAGSKAIDTETGDVYMMNTAGEWNKIFDSEGPSEDGESSGNNENTNGVFIIKTTDYDSDEGTWSHVDKTYEEIKEAFDDGLQPILYCIDGDEVNYVYYFYGIYRQRVEFINIFKSANNTVSILKVTIYSNGTITKN